MRAGQRWGGAPRARSRAARPGPGRAPHSFRPCIALRLSRKCRERAASHRSHPDGWRRRSYFSRCAGWYPGKAAGLGLGPRWEGRVGEHDSPGRVGRGVHAPGWGMGMDCVRARARRTPSFLALGGLARGVVGRARGPCPSGPRLGRLRSRRASAGERPLCASRESGRGEPRRARAGRTAGEGRCPRGTDLARHVHTLLLRCCQVHSRVASCAGVAFSVEYDAGVWWSGHASWSATFFF